MPVYWWDGVMSSGHNGTHSSALLPMMQGDTSLPAVVQWLRLMAASPSPHAAQPHQYLSKRRRHINQRKQQQQQQPVDELHMDPAVTSTNSTQVLPDSFQQPNQHSFQQLLMSDEPIEQPLEQLYEQHQHLPAALVEPESPAATLASAAPSVAAAGEAGEGLPSPCGWSGHHELAYMDCLSQLREAMFADLAPSVPAEVQVLDHASGKATTWMMMCASQN